MVGAAQYRDDEIDWVLSAVVNKRKQSYIQTHFKERFGRSLNHNQIRYIKNKYGKDPRFNSPLVNTRAPRTAASPPSSDLEDHALDEDEADAQSTPVGGPSIQQAKDAALAMIAKRKRDHRDEGDNEVKRRLQHTAKTQRLNPQSHETSTLFAGHHSGPLDAVAQSSTITARLVHSQGHNLSSPAIATAGELYMGVYDEQHLQQHQHQHQNHHHQQLPLQVTDENMINWNPSLHLGGTNNWDFGIPSYMVHGQSNPATLLQNTMPSPTAFDYLGGIEPAATISFSSPASAQFLPQQTPQLQRFSSSIPNLAQPHPSHEEQHQEPHQPITSSTEVAANTGTNAIHPHHLNPEHTATMTHLQPYPSFDQIPIEPASSDTINNALSANPCVGEEFTALAAPDWSRITYMPYEPSPFDAIPPPMAFPFENVRHTGLTATSSQAIRQALRDHAQRHGYRITSASSAVHQSQQQQQHPGSTLPQGISPVASSFELLTMIRNPPIGNNSVVTMTVPPTSALPSSPLLHEVPASDANDTDNLTGTIDPRLLTEHSQFPSPPTDHQINEETLHVFSMSPPPDLPELPGHGQS